ncbi:wax ester/triacylglycerol synthase family O-acyltransferase [Nocardioides panacisoli]|uniref:Diacylglycerol O-acyltransferase n=1 Tax=Nocardioides panacisoli TaxID=627624 RepID=A0ABP7J2K8_9ACTN
MTRERMRPADAAWLRMDSPTNLMVVNSVLWFEDVIPLAELRDVLADRLVARFPRFRQRVTHARGTWWWEDDPDFDLARHLHQVKLPAPQGRRELEALVRSYLTEPLDRARPLWELYVVDRYRGGTALFFRMHHCIADGIALTRVLLSLTDDGDEYVGVAPEDRSRHHGLLAGAAAMVTHEVVDIARHPGHLFDLAAEGASDTEAMARLTALPPDRAFLARRTGREKEVVWSDPIPLARVKRIAHTTGTTVNDVLLAAVSGALRAERERADARPRDVRVVVPFNLHPLDEPLPATLGNRFGLVYLSLPLSRSTPRERLEEMSRRMGRIKSSGDAVVSFGILDAVGRAPYAIERLVVGVFAAKAGGVMTNVAGPRGPVTLGGHTLRGTIGWVPMSGSIGLGLSIFSYAGSVFIGLVVDPLQVENPRRLLEETVDELGLLAATAAEEVTGPAPRARRNRA